jgi:GDP-4-dehydro-6-deoxy-D-mannose reductase
MLKRVFVTGISGFAGSHLADLLVSKGDFDVFGTVFGDFRSVAGLPKNHLIPLNLMDRDKTLEVIGTVKPQWIFHLAALASPAQSFKDPRGTISNNIEAEINVLDAARQITNLEKVLVVGTAEEYGRVIESDLPINEEVPLNPVSPYAISKIAQDYLGLQYFLSYQLPVIRVRPFNHTGDRQAPVFVVPAFAKQIAEIEKGVQPTTIKVGNLQARRDFTDVLDMVNAYFLAMEIGQVGEVYNLGKGVSVKIEDLLNELLKLSSTKINVQQDPDRMMPSDVPNMICDSTKFRKLTGWVPEIPFRETLKRVLEYWRKQ